MKSILLFLVSVLSLAYGALAGAGFLEVDASGRVSFLTSYGSHKAGLNGNVKACVMGEMTYFYLVKSFFSGTTHKELKSPYCEEVLPELKEKINHTRYQVRAYALVASGLLFEKGIITKEEALSMARVGMADSNTWVKTLAVWLLSVLGPSGLPLLLQAQHRPECGWGERLAAWEDCDPTVRQEVMRTLGFMESWTLLEKGLRDKNYGVRREALSALAQVPDFVALPLLRGAFRDYLLSKEKYSPAVLHHWNLYRRKTGKYSKIIAENHKNLIAITDMAFYFYREFQNPEALLLLYQIMEEVSVHPETCSNKNTFCVIFQAQGFQVEEGLRWVEVGFEEGFAPFYSEIEALQLLRYMKGEQSFQLLMNLTHAGNVFVRLEAVRLLKFRPHRHSVPLLQKITQDPEEDSGVKEAALQSLNHLLKQ